MDRALPVSDDTARTWVDVDLARLAANVRALQARLRGSAEILLPVKADAYGHGLVRVGRAARQAGVWGLGVAALEEAAALRDGAVDGPIVCLMPILPAEAARAVGLDVTPSISTADQAHAFDAAARAAGRRLTVHVEVDTGMARGGVWDHDAVPLLEHIAELPGLALEGIFTHFSSADERERQPTETQLDRFEALLGHLTARGIRLSRVHAANSAAALRFRRAAHSVVRPGIAIYGVTDEIAGDGDDGPFDPDAFAPVLSWHTRVLAVKDLRSGDAVSYHRRYIAAGPERIAVLGVGYGDGWPYGLSSRGSVLLRGRPTPIRGAVCMDLTMVDATPFPDLEEGEVATLIGAQGAARQTVVEVGAESGLMSYAVLTGITPRVPRRYTEEREA